MTATVVFVLGLVAAALLAAGGIFAVAYREARQPTVGGFDPRAARRDRARRKEAAAEEARAAAVATEAPASDTATPSEPAEPTPAPDPLLERTVVSEAELNVTRRMFLNRWLTVFWGVFLGMFGLASLAFGWPKLKGGFGSAVVAGKVDDLRNQVFLPDGSIQPVFVAAAQSWIVPFQGDPGGSQFGDNSTIAGGGDNVGLMALWQKCVHLGCRVPDCVSSQGFECPCHGSKYNLHGEYQDGPAPRNMDRFVVSVADNGDFIVDTGQVVQTARAPSKTALYPQGPSCV